MPDYDAHLAFTSYWRDALKWAMVPGAPPQQACQPRRHAPAWPVGRRRAWGMRL